MKDVAVKKKLDLILSLCKKNFQKVDEHLIKKAFYFSFDVHKNQLRKSGDVFFNHPYQVAKIITDEIPLDDISVAAALMHDVIEESNHEIDRDSIKEEFGDTIADIVNGLTKIKDILEGYEIKQAENYRKLFIAVANDIRVILIKFADRLHNMRTLEFHSQEKKIRISQETMELYVPLAHLFGLAKIKWELEDIAFKYLYADEYDELARRISQKRKERESYIKNFIQPIETHLKTKGYKFSIYGRPKNLFSIYQKMKMQNKQIDDINDIFAVRIVLDSDEISNCYAVYSEIVNSVYQAVPGTFKDYIATKKRNNYQSLHTVVFGDDGKKIEVQIRTKVMHEVAEKGIAAHWRYKGISAIGDEEMQEWINSTREIIENLNNVPLNQVVESIKQQLYQREIYIFTPKGELKILPYGSTPIDFAFSVHTDVGMHCIGAKVNGKILPLDTKLQTGDQVEILTSKNQTPSLDWERIVITSRAKQRIRKFFHDNEKKLSDEGKEIFEKYVKRNKIKLSEDIFQLLIKEFHFHSQSQFYSAIAEKKIEIENVILVLEKYTTNKDETIVISNEKNYFANFVDVARKIVSEISFFGDIKGIKYSFANCCHPIPGDEIVGFVTVGEGIKIHRKKCKNILVLSQESQNRIVSVEWPNEKNKYFPAAIKVNGNDRSGIVYDLSNTISSSKTLNIRSINIDAKDGFFEGLIVLDVVDKTHLNSIVESIKKIKGVKFAKRFEEI